MSASMLPYLLRYGPGREAIPGKFNFGVGKGGGGDESSGYGGLEADQLLFMTGAESPSEMSLVVGTRYKRELIINNYPNIELAARGDTGPLLEIILLEEGGSGMCGSEVAVGARFCMSSMYECYTLPHTQ